MRKEMKIEILFTLLGIVTKISQFSKTSLPVVYNPFLNVNY